MVAFADTSVLSRTYAAKTRTQVDPNQEMIGLGAANLAAGLFQGFPISSSSSRTPVAEAAGAKTQLTGVVGAVAVALLLLLAPNLLQDLPNSALAAVVIAAAIGLFEFDDLRRIFRIQRWEFWLSIVCFVGVALFGAIPGIGLAIVIAVIEFLWDGWRPHYAVLGRVDGIRGYHDIKRYPEARLVPGLVLFRWDAPLFFANAELFHQRVLEAVAQSPTPVRRIVVAAEPVTSIDVTSADMLAELEQSLRESGIELRFAEMKDPVKDKLKRFDLFDRFGAANFHPTVGAAVDDYCPGPCGGLDALSRAELPASGLMQRTPRSLVDASRLGLTAQAGITAQPLNSAACSENAGRCRNQWQLSRRNVPSARPRAVIACLLLVAAIGLAGCARKDASAAKSDAGRPVTVTTTRAAAARLQRRAAGAGHGAGARIGDDHRQGQRRGHAAGLRQRPARARRAVAGRHEQPRAAGRCRRRRKPRCATPSSSCAAAPNWPRRS